MKGFFESLNEYRLLSKWAELLDWLIDDNKFLEKRGWTSGYIGLFIKRIKRLPYISKNKTYQYDSIKNLVFPSDRIYGVKLIFSKGAGEAKDLIRHIRNSIAHGNASCYICKQEHFIELKDYTNDSKNVQTAYLSLPLAYIEEIYKLYYDIQKSFSNSKNKINSKEK